MAISCERAVRVVSIILLSCSGTVAPSGPHIQTVIMTSRNTPCYSTNMGTEISSSMPTNPAPPPPKQTEEWRVAEQCLKFEF